MISVVDNVFVLVKVGDCKDIDVLCLMLFVGKINEEGYVFVYDIVFYINYDILFDVN